MSTRDTGQQFPVMDEPASARSAQMSLAHVREKSWLRASAGAARVVTERHRRLRERAQVSARVGRLGAEMAAQYHAEGGVLCLAYPRQVLAIVEECGPIRSGSGFIPASPAAWLRFPASSAARSAATANSMNVHSSGWPPRYPRQRPDSPWRRSMTPRPARLQGCLPRA
jgi:hypothetical protein